MIEPESSARMASGIVLLVVGVALYLSGILFTQPSAARAALMLVGVLLTVAGVLIIPTPGHVEAAP